MFIISRNFNKLVTSAVRNCARNFVNEAASITKAPDIEQQDDLPAVQMQPASEIIKKERKTSFYKERKEKPSDTYGVFSYYFKDSGLLQELFRLGVNLHKIEKNHEAAQLLLQLQFEDIREHIIFLKDLGLSFQEIGNVITKNPLLLKEDLDDLNVRINYLHYKKFDNEMVTRIVSDNPHWLSHSTQEIDERLGFFQQHFGLTGNEVRQLAVQRPKLITYSLETVKVNTFALTEEMGFTNEEIKRIILKKPKLLVNSRNNLLKTFDYLHNIMKISLERIVEEPEVLTCREKRLKLRHMFLEKLGRDQFDPLKPNYISMTALVSGTDAEFAVDVAKSSVDMYNNFLKSI